MCAIELGVPAQDGKDTLVLTAKQVRRLNAVFFILELLVVGLGLLTLCVNNERKNALQKIEQLKSKLSQLELERSVQPLPSDLLI